MTGELARLSLNSETTHGWSLREVAEGAARAGLPAIGLWRSIVADAGLAESARMVADNGLRVSSLCRGGFLTGRTDDDAWRALDDNYRAIDEAAALGAAALVMVVGGLPAATVPGGPALPPAELPRPTRGLGVGRGTDPDRDLAAARGRVAERLAELAPRARAAGVRLALEPLHPMFAADRAVISTLGQALDLAEPFDPAVVGVVVDTYHVWWDPDLERQVARAGRAGRIASYQVCDWVLPLAADPLNSRGHVGDGYIDFPYVTSLVRDAGYRGDVEVEIFNEEIWRAGGDETIRILADRYVRHVLPFLDDAP